MKHAPPPEIPPADLAAACRALDCPVPEDALPPLNVYLTLLMRWNRAMNLVGAKTWRAALQLAADSFFLARFLDGLPLPAAPLTWDLGAGAGLPGIPLRMVWQAGEYHMVEARERRAIFLHTALARLALPRTVAVCERAEQFFVRMRARPADCILSRAFMPPKRLLPFVADALAPDGFVCIAAAKHAAPFPEPWRLAAEYAYTLGGARRCFLALRKNCLSGQPDTIMLDQCPNLQ